jgi:hypothetical protein
MPENWTKERRKSGIDQVKASRCPENGTPAMSSDFIVLPGTLGVQSRTLSEARFQKFATRMRFVASAWA